MADLVLIDVCKSFGGVDVLKDVNLKITSGELVVIVGPSGCGKSTLLRMIAGLEDVTSGSIDIDGNTVNDLAPSKRGIAMVFQSYALYPHMSAYDNMAFGLKLKGTGKEELDARVFEAADMLQISHLLDRLPKQLSGGQRQRVAIGRAITRKPKLFLFDEPLSNLDAGLRAATRVEIAGLHANMTATTMIYVTHDQVEAMTLADRIVVLNNGHIEQVGTPLELYGRPANLFVAGFIGSPAMNIIPCRIEPGDHGIVASPQSGRPVEFRVDDAPANKISGWIGIRPEHLSLAGDGDVQFSGKASFSEQLGEYQLVHVELDAVEQPLIVKAPAEADIAAGTTVNITAPGQKLHLFNEDGVAYRRCGAT